VKDQHFVPDDGDKLPDHKGDSNSMSAGSIPVPFAGRGTVFEARVCRSRDIEIRESCKDEAEHCSCKDNDWVCQQRL